ncbi:MAG: methyltransferase, partial [Candidatus Lokiarchaeota archaeon]|nr:methyltransferase [Candidatus Lokiarchaeota archaeon]MBD3200915.1 methyltransferase [Candidatus Lokiarchaeota archaeon]
IRPISDIIEEYQIERIDLLKIDAENYETQVLKGISDSDWDIINQIVVEVHEHIEGGENLLIRIKKLFDSKGFKTVRGEDTRRPSLGVYMLYARK